MISNGLMDVCMRNLRQKAEGERKLVVSLLPGSHKHLASRNPCILCQKHGGARTTYYLGVPTV
jgi:hypothetical protein